MKLIFHFTFITFLSTLYGSIGIGFVSGKCIERHQCGPCRRHWDPICGSDGVTYSNSCTLSCTRNCNPELQIAYEGECGGSQEDGFINSEDMYVTEADDDYNISNESEEEDDEEDEEEEEEEDRRRRLLKFKYLKFF